MSKSIRDLAWDIAQRYTPAGTDAHNLAASIMANMHGLVAEKNAEIARLKAGASTYQVLKLGVQKPVAEWTRPGKAEWPNTIVVEMSQRQAICQVARIADQLENNQDEISITLVGKLEDIEEDE